VTFLLDSSGWIEYLTDGPNAGAYGHYLKHPEKLITPTIVLYEVYKKIKRERTEEEALKSVSLMKMTAVKELTESIALFAADVSIRYSLPMADAMVYATAMETGCSVVTSDAHFKDLDHVVFVP
jgi:toxin FitB